MRLRDLLNFVLDVGVLVRQRLSPRDGEPHLPELVKQPLPARLDNLVQVVMAGARLIRRLVLPDQRLPRLIQSALERLLPLRACVGLSVEMLQLQPSNITLLANIINRLAERCS